MSEIIGYARVSSTSQNLDAQMDALKRAGCTHTFTDKDSGATSSRPGWRALLAYIRHSARFRENLSTLGHSGEAPPGRSPRMPHSSRSDTLDHLGRVAVMLDAHGIGDVIAQATHQHPALRIVTAGTAVTAMVIHGLDVVNQPRYRVPHFWQKNPTSRLVASCIAARHLNDDPWGRALDTLSADGVTELYRLIAATAARRLGLRPTFAHLDSTRFHANGRYNSGEVPEEPVIHITRGYSRDHRPDLNPVMRDWIVEHQAGISVWMQPLSGNSRDTRDGGQVVREHRAP